ncbi:AAA family ATPase [Chitinophaga sp. CF418]|uniref:AAA family ATPase n=1 Tax=Chitinophaga sp. CF418 TaxID=1855287 RepID=UPI00090F16EC|nr:ATP-binding protein [Chitinophaga sp. CF418]SHM47774.1 nicotinamide-nucleotide adenylyltransferase, NadR type [Chitinophaga sp. CF418]
MLKVVVIGPESTGKSTLSEQLATHYQTVWVPEYARQYLEELPRSYEQHDLLTIAEGQLALEDNLAAQANKLLICDTDLHVIKVWSEHKYGACDPRILEQIATRPYDLYLLTYIDIPWEEDPQREYPDPAMREYFYTIYRDLVAASGVPWVEIKGSFEERKSLAVTTVDKLLRK